MIKLAVTALPIGSGHRIGQFRAVVAITVPSKNCQAGFAADTVAQNVASARTLLKC